jgi:hypothetical protein
MAKRDPERAAAERGKTHIIPSLRPEKELDETFAQEQHPGMVRVLLAASPEALLKQQQDDSSQLIACQALKPLKDIAQQFDQFVDQLAKANGVNRQQFLQDNPGFQCQGDSQFLMMTFPDRSTMSQFLQTLDQKGMIKIPENLRDQFSQHSAPNPFSTRPEPGKASTPEQPERTAPTPFAMTPKPPGFDKSS